MPINLDDPRKFRPLVGQAHQVAMNMLRPISRKYDKAEHAYPHELDMLAAMIDGLSESGAGEGAGAAGVRRSAGPGADDDGGAGSAARDVGGVKNGANLASVMSIAEMCWGDVGLLLSMPRQGLGNSAIASVANDEQLARFEGVWAAMAITEPGTGSDSANIKTTAVRDGDEYVLNGEKIFVTSGDRADAVVVWATLDRDLGRAAIKSFVVPKGTPGMRVERLEHKLGIKASDTATIIFDECRVPAANLLGSPEIDTLQGFAGAMATFDNTRPLVASMAVGCAKAALDLTRDLLERAGVEVDYDRPALTQSAAAAKFLQMEADWEAAHLLMLQAAWMADNRAPNSLEASMAQAKAGRVATDITLSCVELAGSVGYGEAELLEKWARDSKILDIFEGTQQIQQLIVARRVLGLTSAELK
jgi:acyl-CoA dehydrogenase